MNKKLIKANRIYTPVKKYAWLFVLLVAVGGLFLPKLGLLIIPVMLSLAVMGFLKGKYWCGNICPHGSLFDGLILPVSLNVKMPSVFKSKILIVLAFAGFMFMLGSRLVEVSTHWGTTPFLDKLGYVFVFNYLVVTVIGTSLALIVNPRAWCSFCPMGTFQLLTYKLGRTLGLNHKTDTMVTLTSKEECKGCGKCSQVCPMQLNLHLEFSDSNIFDEDVCIRCSICTKNCPSGILSMSNRKRVITLNREGLSSDAGEQTPLGGG